MSCILTKKKERKRKNILIIHIDDNAYCFIGPFGFSNTLCSVLPMRHLSLDRELPPWGPTTQFLGGGLAMLCSGQWAGF